MYFVFTEMKLLTSCDIVWSVVLLITLDKSDRVYYRGVHMNVHLLQASSNFKTFVDYGVCTTCVQYYPCVYVHVLHGSGVVYVYLQVPGTQTCMTVLNALIVTTWLSVFCISLYNCDCTSKICVVEFTCVDVLDGGVYLLFWGEEHAPH